VTGSVDKSRNGASDDRTLGDHVTELVQHEIMTGGLAPGEKLSEPELAVRFGVGRGSMREALHRLEGMRLVERRPRQGARVVAIGPTELIALYDVRESLEGMAARLAAGRMDGGQIAQVRHLLDAHERRPDVRADTGYFQEAGPADFHFQIVQGSGNAELIAMVEQLSHRVRMFRYRSSHLEHRPQRALKEHTNILDAIEARDGELAEILLRRHIRAARDAVEHAMRRDGEAGD
jgi:DNA-binding GntR family transcriptional regulator